MKIQTSELDGLALDWAVAKCAGIQLNSKLLRRKCLVATGVVGAVLQNGNYSPSRYWAQGGPIIERERIGLKHRSYDSPPWWVAVIDVPDTSVTKRGCIGPTPLVAGMRCFVASKLGDEIDVPKELLIDKETHE